MDYLWAFLFILVLFGGWVLTLFSLPGNWLMVAVAGLYAWFEKLPWWVAIALLVLALIGELVELLAGAVGAKQAGGSKRGAGLAILGAMIGSMIGAVVGLPIPIIGSVVAILLFASVGATAGAFVGESWKGRPVEHGWKVGVVAFWSRLFGTMGKLLLGAVMVAVGCTGELLWLFNWM